MMYPYIELADETLITHSHLKEENGVKTVSVHFERPKPYGFDIMGCAYYVFIILGFILTVSVPIAQIICGIIAFLIFIC